VALWKRVLDRVSKYRDRGFTIQLKGDTSCMFKSYENRKLIRRRRQSFSTMPSSPRGVYLEFEGIFAKHCNYRELEPWRPTAKLRRLAAAAYVAPPSDEKQARFPAEWGNPLPPRLTRRTLSGPATLTRRRPERYFQYRAYSYDLMRKRPLFLPSASGGEEMKKNVLAEAPLGAGAKVGEGQYLVEWLLRNGNLDQKSTFLKQLLMTNNQVKHICGSWLSMSGCTHGQHATALE
jgi:hypothetical protein